MKRRVFDSETLTGFSGAFHRALLVSVVLLLMLLLVTVLLALLVVVVMMLVFLPSFAFGFTALLFLLGLDPRFSFKISPNRAHLLTLLIALFHLHRYLFLIFSLFHLSLSLYRFRILFRFSIFIRFASYTMDILPMVLEQRVHALFATLR